MGTTIKTNLQDVKKKIEHFSEIANVNIRLGVHNYGDEFEIVDNETGVYLCTTEVEWQSILEKKKVPGFEVGTIEAVYSADFIGPEGDNVPDSTHRKVRDTAYRFIVLVGSANISILLEREMWRENG